MALNIISTTMIIFGVHCTLYIEGCAECFKACCVIFSDNDGVLSNNADNTDSGAPVGQIVIVDADAVVSALLSIPF